MTRYMDLLQLPYPLPRKRTRMPRLARAAQFAPFDALTGYDECVQEAARMTEGERILTEEEKENLDRTTHQLMARIEQHPYVRLTCFFPDPRKKGGAYRILEGHLCHIDLTRRLFVLEHEQLVPTRAIVAIDCGRSSE
jgi:hypothetical protein